MYRACLLAVGVGVLLYSLPVASCQEKSDADRIQGAWKIIKVEVEGKPPPAEFLEKGRFVFKGNKVAIFHDDKLTEEATFALDATRKPPTIDLTATEGPGKGKTMYGIYRIEGDTLTLCIGDKRPSEFKAEGKAGVVQF